MAIKWWRLLLLGVLLGMTFACQSIPPETRSFAARMDEHDAIGRNDPTTGIAYEAGDANDVLVATVPYAEGQTIDLFYPPGFDFRSDLPVVVFVNGFRDEEIRSLYSMRLMDSASYLTWCAAIATEGLAAVTYGTASPFQSSKDVLLFLTENRKGLSLDTDRLALFAVSDNGVTLYNLMGLKDFPPVEHVRAAVIYYSSLSLGSPKPVAPAAFFLGKGGASDTRENAIMDKAATLLSDAGHRVVVAEHPTGPHGFDYLSHDETSVAIIRRTLDFLKTELE